MAFDINAARQSGYSDNEIIEYLGQSSPSFDVKGAVNAGYSIDEIANEIQSPTKKTWGEKAVGAAEKAQDVMAWPFKKAAEYIPGVAPVLGAFGKVTETIQKPFDIAGEKTTEFLGSKDVPAPISAAVGLPIQMTPDILASIAGAGPTKKAAQLGAKSVKTGTKAATSPIRKVAQLVKSPGVEEAKALANQTRASMKLRPTLAEKAVKRGKEKIAPLTKKLQELEQYKTRTKLEASTKKARAEEELGEAGKEIGKLEEASGIGLKQIPLPKPVTKPRRFAQLMGKVAETPVEKLGSKYDPVKLQTMRKQAQLASKASGVPSEYKVLINQGREQLGKTLDTKLGESFEVARKNWQMLDDKLEAIPQEVLKKQTITSQLLKSTKGEIAKEQQRVNKLIARSKKIDARGLAKVEAQLAESVAKAAKKDAVIDKLKTAAIGAAGLAGLGGTAAWMLK